MKNHTMKQAFFLIATFTVCLLASKKGSPGITRSTCNWPILKLNLQEQQLFLKQENTWVPQRQ
jgi:hypothetical protein